jgi:hypothetical protein
MRHHLQSSPRLSSEVFSKGQAPKNNLSRLSHSKSGENPSTPPPASTTHHPLPSTPPPEVEGTGNTLLGTQKVRLPSPTALIQCYTKGSSVVHLLIEH